MLVHADGFEWNGRRYRSLTIIDKVADLYRDLARAHPKAFTPDVAMSLNTLANSLSEVGRREEALAASQEAAELYRDLAWARPEVFTPDLAKSLELSPVACPNSVAARRRWRRRRRRSNLIAIWRERVPRHSRPNWARRSTLSPVTELGRRGEARAVTREAEALRAG